MNDFPILRDKLALWRFQSKEGAMDLRDYNRRAALELETLLGSTRQDGAREGEEALEKLGRAIMALPPGMRTENPADGIKKLRAMLTAPPAPDEAVEAKPEDAWPHAVAWAVERWKAEVANRELVNVHRRSLDDAWRQVIRHFGGDPDELVGPSHDELRARSRRDGGGEK